MDYLLIIIALRSFKHIIIIEDGLNFDSIHDRFRIYRLNNDLQQKKNDARRKKGITGTPQDIPPRTVTQVFDNEVMRNILLNKESFLN